MNTAKIFSNNDLNLLSDNVLPLADAPFVFGEHLAWEGAFTHLAKYNIPEKIPGSGNPYINPDVKLQYMKWLNDKIIPSIQGNDDLIAFENKCYSKWYGPQGGTPTKNDILTVIRNYYERVDLTLSSQDFLTPTDKELSALFKGANLEPRSELLSPTQLYKLYKGDRKSNSALTSWSDRREKKVRVLAISQAAKKPNSIDPAVVGTRDQRQKVPCRCIFMDSFANYYREINPLHIFEEVWKNSDHVAWRGDRYVERYIQNFLQKHPKVIFFESDYETMDTWVQNAHGQFIWKILSEHVKMSQELYQRGSDILSEVFKMPLVTPDGVIYNCEHSLFSGIYPTNPLESPLNLLINIQWISRVVSPSVGRWLEIDKDYIIIVLGDDVIVIFDNEDGSISNLDLPNSFSFFAWNNYHILAKSEKQRMSSTSGFFCKRQFRLKGKQVQYDCFPGLTTKSIYPLNLVLLNNFEPEDGPMDNKAQTLIKVFQTFDNAFAHPMWHIALERYFNIVPELHFEVSVEDIDEFNARGSNSWRIRLYGEKFDISKSPSAQLWYRLCASNNK